MATLKQSIYRATAVLGVVGVVLSPVVASAATDSKNTTVTAVIDSSITMTVGGNVSFNIVPTAGGIFSSSSDTVSVSTNHGAGYNLTLADADATTTLADGGGNSIAAVAGTMGSPTAGMTVDTWGWRVDGAGGFGAGPTTAETNVSTSTHTWAGVPASGAPVTLKTTGSTASNDTTTVWYGAKVSTAKPNGSYSDIVTYTATTN